MIDFKKLSATCIFSTQDYLMSGLTTLSIVEQLASHLREEILILQGQWSETIPRYKRIFPASARNLSSFCGTRA